MTTNRPGPELRDVYQDEVAAGYRLDYFEAYNWGTFHERIGRAKLDGQTTLLTGENGAGKSTLADGIVTLLVPTNKRNYNAASSDAKRERSEPDCCETTDALWHGSDQALTITGLYKGRTGRRVKDDRHDINDRHNWILGWDNHDKLTLLKVRLKEVENQGSKALKDANLAKTARENHGKRLAAAESLMQGAFTFEQISEVDIQTLIAGKITLRDGLKKDPALAKLSSDIAIAAKDLKEKNKIYEEAVSTLAVAENHEEQNLAEIDRLRALTATHSPELENTFILIARRATEPIRDIESLDARKSALHQGYTNEIADQTTAADTNAAAAVMKMAEIVDHPEWGHLHDELGSTLAGDISFDSLEDLTRYIGKKAEAERILANAAIVTAELPKGPVVDLGFKLYRALGNASKLTTADIVRITEDGARRVEGATRAGLFTYAATIRRIVDGDTMLVALEIAPGITLEKLLRLRGLDCAEMNTAAGRAAKRFVEEYAGAGDEVVLSTTKPDKYDRSLADVFITKPRSLAQLSATDDRVAADGGVFLNNALLQNGHAVRYDGGPKDE